MVLLLYVDDFLIAAPNYQLINSVRNLLKGHFELKELGPIQQFLAMEITRDRVNRYIYISQRQYTYKIIEKYSYKDLNAAATPWPSNLELPTI